MRAPMASRALTTLLVAACLATAGCAQVLPDQVRDSVDGDLANGWAHGMVQADALREDGLTGQGVTVGVVDTGVGVSHEAFRERTVPWKDYVNDQPEPYDDGGHGTHVSGMAVAKSTGGFTGPNVKGIAPGADLVHAKAIEGNGEGSGSDVADAIDWTVDRGVDVLVLSLGGTPSGLPLQDATESAVQDAVDQGVVVVAAAGNAGQGESGEDCQVATPATVKGAIAVGAVREDRQIAEFSCSGGSGGGGPLGVQEREDPHRKPELSAPGVELVGAWPERTCGEPNAKYCVLSGTSQATPIVGGLVALLLEEHPDLKRGDRDTVYHVKRALAETADKPGFSGHHKRYGYGIPQGEAASTWIANNEVQQDDGGLPGVPNLPHAR